VDDGRSGSFSIIAELGAGGMARVFAARRHDSGELCALKQLRETVEDNPRVRARFQREAQLASLLHHPNIARVHGSGFDAGRFSIASELIRGQTVESLLNRLGEGAPLPPRISVAIARAVLDGLAYAHHLAAKDGTPLEIVHRDLSPRNIMVSYSGDVKIIDFGVARSNIDDFKTSPGALVGTLRYMSPEQACAALIDGRSDLYTLGVVLYEMLSGHCPVSSGRAVNVLIEICSSTPPPLSSVRSALPKSFDALLVRALAKQPEDRFPDAATFKEALIAAAGKMEIAGREELGAFVRGQFPNEEADSARLVDATEDTSLGTITLVRPVDPEGPTEIREKPGPSFGVDARVEETAIVRRDRAKNVLPRDIEIERLSRSLERAKLAIVGLGVACVAGAAFAYFAGRSSSDERAGAEIAEVGAAPADETPPPRPMIAPRRAEVEAEAPEERSPPPRSARRAAVEGAKESVKAPAKSAVSAAARSDTLAERVARLERTPDDHDLFITVFDELKARIELLPPADRSVAIADLQSAERTASVERLRRVFDLVSRSKPQ
jgi:protein kinase-like protein